MEIVGHKDVINLLKSSALRDRSEKSYLFVGPEGVGKLKVALWFSLQMAWLGDILLITNNPNYYNEKVSIKKFDHSLKIENIREAQEFLLLRPFKDRKAVILDNFHLATLEAQNALLKVLEEPPQNGFIILVSSKIAKIIPTILSRVRKINFPFLKTEEIVQFLNKKYSLDQEKLKKIVSYSWGSLGRAIKIAEDLKGFEERRSMYFKIFSPRISERLKLVDYLEKHSQYREEFLEETAFYLRGLIKKYPLSENLAIFRKIFNFITYLESYNLNFNWQLEYFLISLDLSSLRKV